MWVMRGNWYVMDRQASRIHSGCSHTQTSEAEEEQACTHTGGYEDNVKSAVSGTANDTSGKQATLNQARQRNRVFSLRA